MTDPDPMLDDPVADLLRAERPVPRAGFRAALRARILSMSGARRAAPPRLRVLIAAYAASGAVVLLVIAIGTAGAGPFAA